MYGLCRVFLYGPRQRPLVCLPTQLRPNMPCKNIIFLVDTGAPSSELSPAACSPLLGSEAEPLPPHAAPYWVPRQSHNRRMCIYQCLCLQIPSVANTQRMQAALSGGFPNTMQLLCSASRGAGGI